jgi:hypothetical protein
MLAAIHVNDAIAVRATSLEDDELLLLRKMHELSAVCSRDLAKRS